MSDNAPVEGKVWAGTAGAGAGLTISAFLIWLLGGLVWGAPMDAAHSADAAAAVPGPVIGMVLAGITVGTTFLAGYRARHTSRRAAPYMGGGSTPTDDTPVPTDPAPVGDTPGAFA